MGAVSCGVAAQSVGIVGWAFDRIRSTYCSACSTRAVADVALRIVSLTLRKSVAALQHGAKAAGIGEALRSCHGSREHGYGEDLGVHGEGIVLIDYD